MELIGEFVARSAAACSGWVAALDHEIGDDAVECDFVVITTLRQIEEIGAGEWSFGGVKCQVDVAYARVDGDFDVGHGAQETSDFPVWQHCLPFGLRNVNPGIH